MNPLWNQACDEADFLIEQALENPENNKVLIEKALVIYTQIFEQEPSFARPYLGLAYLALSLNQEQRAFDLLETARSKEPFNTEITQMRGQFEAYVRNKSNKHAEPSEKAGVQRISSHTDSKTHDLVLRILEPLKAISSSRLLTQAPVLSWKNQLSETQSQQLLDLSRDATRPLPERFKQLQELIHSVCPEKEKTPRLFVGELMQTINQATS